ncbi:MAG TPA: hypothetical protein VEP67_12245 [Thiobacillaceae bacterium]|nr:hypothetical protein [Thiobacillaceae bacterium]
MRKSVIAMGFLMTLAGVSYAASDWLKGSTEEQLKSLAGLQPGLGTVMIEYSNRFSTMYYDAKGGNWDMAGYQLKEAKEIQEVGETTRPARAKALKDFESHYLDPLDEAIKAKDWKKFKTAFDDAEKGCNTCHKSQGFPYIKYELPKASPSPTSVKP